MIHIIYSYNYIDCSLVAPMKWEHLSWYMQRGQFAHFDNNEVFATGALLYPVLAILASP